MTDSPDDLEHAVEASRSRLDRTLDDLQSRLNRPTLVRDLGTLRASGETLRMDAGRLLAGARTDPVPALLICAGLGLLVYEAFRAGADRRRSAMASGRAAAFSDRDLAENQAGPMQARLDEALEESFPGSDPVSVRITR